MADAVTAPVTNEPAPSAASVFETWRSKGKHPEIAKFEKGLLTSSVLSPDGTTGRVTGVSMNVWDFIEDAIHGTGGFADGSYLVPHKRERSGNKGWAKFAERCETADYDDFARTIHEGPINYIVQSKDQIKRETENKRLEAWWTNVDGEGEAIEDFLLGFPADQARAYGTAWVFIDRDSEVRSASDNIDSEPYLYAVPTRNVVWWEFDSEGTMISLVVLEPRDSDEATRPCPVRVWTLNEWATWEPNAPAKGGSETSVTTYTPTGGGVNELGRVPAVRLFDQPAAPKRGLGSSIMLQVARVARTVYNMESEAREIMRRSAFPILAIPTKDAGAVTKLEIGESSGLPYDSDGGQPAWIEPNLNSLDKYEARIEKKKDAAFSVAHMKAVTGSVKTASGFHTEAEFDETNRSIGDFAASLESCEMEIATLYQLFLGVKLEVALKACSVSYPREFKLRDIDALVTRTQARLNMGLGEDDAFEAIRDLYTAIYPRKAQDEIDLAARKAAGERAKAQKAESDAAQASARVKGILGKPKPKSAPPGK